jgi:BirA family biotin operon repressor/biotin-[acetyl-CoA-carboxylase] ligase
MRKVIRLKTTSSTQDEAFAQAEQGADDGTLIVAMEQTAGRGRMRREWVSPRDAGAYFSVVCRLGDPSRLAVLPFAAGIAAAKAIARLTHLDPRLKWPNDVLMGNKKVAGVLVESRTSGQETVAAVGVGVNLRAEGNPFVQENPELATALDLHCDRIPDAHTLAEAFADEFDDPRRQPLDQLLGEWQKLDETIGAEIEARAGGKTVTGTAKGLDRNGALLVEALDGSIESFMAGDVTITRWRPRR